MLLSPLAIYRTLSTQVLKQWSRQLLRVAACKRTQPPADSRACSVTSEAAGPLQQVQHSYMTTGYQRRDSLVTSQQHSLSGARATAMGINSRTGRASKASIAAPAAGMCGAGDPSSSSTGSETLIALERWVNSSFHNSCTAGALLRNPARPEHPG